MTQEREIFFTDGEGNTYTAYFGDTVVSAEDADTTVYEPLWNTRVNDFGAGIVQPAYIDGPYNRLEFFKDEQEMLNFFNQFPLTRVEPR